MNAHCKNWRSSRFVHGSVVAAMVGIAMLFSPSRSEAQICTAALDVDVHYCLNPADCPGTNTLALKVGDVVTLTMEVTNDSQFQGGALSPDGSLQGPATPGLVPPPGQFTISYACSASTCLAGEVLPGVFTFNGATVLPDAGGNATFTDNGNGTGTLSVTNAGIPYAGNVGKFLVQVQLTVASALPDGTVIFARAEGNKTAFLITDNACLPGLTGTGEGSTAAQFATTVKQCGNTGRITFPTATKLGNVNVALRAPGQLSQIVSGPATLTMSNAGGACFSASIPPQTNPCKYLDKSARTNGGIYKITCQQRASNGGQIQIRVQAYGDTTACNVAAMTTDVVLDGVSFTHSGTWRPTPNGWRFP